MSDLDDLAKAARERNDFSRPVVYTGREAKRFIICPNPNCGFRGLAIRKARGSIVIAIILSVLLFPIGLIYWMFFSGFSYRCPRCGMEARRT